MKVREFRCCVTRYATGYGQFRHGCAKCAIGHWAYCAKHAPSRLVAQDWLAGSVSTAPVLLPPELHVQRKTGVWPSKSRMQRPQRGTPSISFSALQTLPSGTAVLEHVVFKASVQLGAPLALTSTGAAPRQWQLQPSPAGSQNPVKSWQIVASGRQLASASAQSAWVLGRAVW